VERHAGAIVPPLRGGRWEAELIDPEESGRPRGIEHLGAAAPVADVTRDERLSKDVENRTDTEWRQRL
jgi:hypothetical protein